MRHIVTLMVLFWFWMAVGVSTQDQDQELFVATLTAEEMSGKQGVLETDLGIIVIDLLPDVAPNHVGLFIKLVRAGEYDGTTFHRVVKHGIVQGGDPLSKDPNRTDVYGRGGLGLVDAEFSDEIHTRGAVSAVLVPGQLDSGGSQFFICVVDQPSLNGRHTIWGRVSEGMDIVTAISEIPVDPDGRSLERVTVRSAIVRDRPPLEPIPFTEETDSDLAVYRAVIQTNVGNIEIDFYPDLAPNHVRNFLRLSEAGVFDGMGFHRIVKGFVIQTGYLPSRREPLTEKQQQFVQTLDPEFSDTRHVKGIVSMARGDDVASASTSFFICTDVAEELDGQYTVFGVVISGIEVVETIEAFPTDGEKPKSRIEIIQVKVIQH